jgi:A/G-specific adenine glycosylase
LELQALPGIGPSTAAAIASLAFNQSHAIFDGNVKRVLSRVFSIKGPINHKTVIKILFDLANACMPKENCKEYTQAIMDLGATLCKPKQPKCLQCPMHEICQAYLKKETHLIPQKAEKKAAKIVEYHFVGYFNQNAEIFLEQRPNQGIWSNLWCFPNYRPDTLDQAQLHYKHQLTHQNMDIKVYLKPKFDQNTYHGRWMSEHEDRNFGLPQAISSMLEEIFLCVKSALRTEHQVDQKPLHD